MCARPALGPPVSHMSPFFPSILARFFSVHPLRACAVKRGIPTHVGVPLHSDSYNMAVRCFDYYYGSCQARRQQGGKGAAYFRRASGCGSAHALRAPLKARCEVRSRRASQPAEVAGPPCDDRVAPPVSATRALLCAAVSKLSRL